MTGYTLTIPAPVTGDNCGVDTVVNDYNGSADASATYPAGVTTVVWTVTDVNGNVNTCTQTITITAVDSDFDGVPDNCDVCPGGDDTVDTDFDGVPDFCDICPGGDDSVDTDGDTVPDFCDVCPGGDDTVDTDGDLVPDFCEIAGCEDPTACNYNSAATDDAGNCIYLDPLEPCDYCSGETDGTGVIVDGDIDNDGTCDNLPCPGDFNGDGFRNTSDLLLLLGSFSCTGGGCVGDITGDGDTNTSDLLDFIVVFNIPCP